MITYIDIKLYSYASLKKLNTKCNFKHITMNIISGLYYYLGHYVNVSNI